MRTELARVQTEAQKQSMEKNGFEEYTFIANGGCCDICQGINGKHFKIAKMMPGENAPPMHPFVVARFLLMRIPKSTKHGLIF